MTILGILGFPAVLFLASVALTVLLIRVSGRIGLIDRPNHRSMHEKPTPRAGGIAIVVTWTVAILIAVPARGALLSFYYPLLVSGLIIAILGLLDDRYGLSARLRLIVQIGTAALAIGLPVGIGIWVGEGGWGGIRADPAFGPGFFLKAIGLLAFVAISLAWMTNLYNFMDGIDGIAATQAVVCCWVYGILSYQAGRPDLAAVFLMLSCSVAGFLVLNWRPAKIFMGDVGSGFLGYVLGFLGFVSVLPSNRISLAAYLAPLMPFILDTGITLGRRFLAGKKLTEAHREHFYQRLVQKGLSHQRVTLLYAMMGVIFSLPFLLWKG
ncbi:MAG: glycosyltransferase family 4 protein [Bdellovibrionales bacterium]|nr:glycosyltransferase family 4 protein [Bdellovibrionales bacterium]